MAEVVIKVPVRSGAQIALFGDYFNRFMESRTAEADRIAARSDAPYLMLRSDPAAGDMEVKVLTFQQRSAARAFSVGWERELQRVHGA